MPDLEDQLRIYYEATTEPIDVDTITVDPGTVIVGPFPEAAQRRSAMTAPTKPRETRPWWKNAWAAAAAFVLVVAVAGAAVLASSNPEADADNVAAPAPTEPTLTFDGQRCAYDGPTELGLEADRAVAILNESDSLAMVVAWTVPDGTAIEEAAATFREHDFAAFGPDGWVELHAPQFVEPRTRALLRASFVPGQVLLGCGNGDEAVVTQGAATFPIEGVEVWPILLTVSQD